MPPTVVATCLNPLHTFSKLPQPSIQLLAGLGVRGDAHCGATVQHVYLRRKNPHAPNLMQVHLLQSELFDELNERGHTLEPGGLGENFTTAGIDLLRLPTGTQLHIGREAVVELTGLRTPCRQIDRFQTGLQTQLTDRTLPANRRGRAGVMAVVLHSGVCRARDAIGVELPSGPLQPLTYL